MPFSTYEVNRSYNVMRRCKLIILWQKKVVSRNFETYQLYDERVERKSFLIQFYIKKVCFELFITTLEMPLITTFWHGYVIRHAKEKNFTENTPQKMFCRKLLPSSRCSCTFLSARSFIQSHFAGPTGRILWDTENGRLYSFQLVQGENKKNHPPVVLAGEGRVIVETRPASASVSLLERALLWLEV